MATVEELAVQELRDALDVIVAKAEQLRTTNGAYDTRLTIDFVNDGSALRDKVRARESAIELDDISNITGIVLKITKTVEL